MLSAPTHPDVLDPAAACPVAMALHPIMSYTRRPVAYDVQCSRPWAAGTLRWNSPLGECGSPATLFSAQAGHSLPAFTVPAVMDPEECRTTLPGGALLLLESPETAASEVELQTHCSRLRAAGFQVGIADYRGEPVWNGILPTLSHIRFGCKGPLFRRKELLTGPLRHKVTFVANGVDTETDLNEAMRAGFQLFQGSFAHKIGRLQWPAHEFQRRALLLREACADGGVSADLLARCLSYHNLGIRFGTLLLSAGIDRLGISTDPEVLYAELGPDRVQQFVQISLAEDMAGKSSPILIHRLFQVARFHELMREYALSEPSSTARFEGLIQSGLAAIGDTPAEQEASRYAAALLKQSLGTPMKCSAFYRNLAIADAYDRAQWAEADRLGLADGFAPDTVRRLFQTATLWAHTYLRPSLG